MSQATDGAPAPESARPALLDDRLRFAVGVDPACIEAGYNASGLTVMSVDAARLAPEDRALLRRLLLPRDDRDPGAPHALLYRQKRIHLAAPTLGALAETFALIRESEAAETRRQGLEEAAHALVTEALGRVLPRFEPDAAFYAWHPTYPTALFPKPVVEAVREEAGPAIQAAGEAADAAYFALADLHARIGGLPVRLDPPPVPVDWLGETLREVPAERYLRLLDGAWVEPHALWARAVAGANANEQRKRQHAESPQGRIEAVIADGGTSSQLERWRAGMLPDAEADALVAAHLFRDVLKESAPETRLDRDAVARALREVRPSASVTKVAFSTEEAQGLDEAEWEAFKAIRAALPDKATAHVVRTLAHVQTAADGSFVARRPLAALKGTFEGREVRVRVDLGVGISLQTA